MSRELSTTYNGAGANLYCIVRKTSDGTVWNVAHAAFEVWADGTIGSYAIAMTDRGGDLYDGDFPSAITAGDYRIYYYERAGGSPAITDLVLKAPLVHWDGAAMSSVSTVSLSPYALTDLDSAKRRMGITDSASDTLVTEYINQVSAEIERVTGVNFRARDYREWKNGARQREMCLNHYPVQSPPRVAFGSAVALSVQFTAGTNIRASAGIYRDPEQPDAGGMRLETISSTGTSIVTNLAFATYKSVSALATAIAAVSGWTATTISNQPTGDLHPCAAQDTLGKTSTFTYPDRVDYTYSINNRNGKLRFDNLGVGLWSWWGSWPSFGASDLQMPTQWQHVLVQYRGGWETIPADVQLIANEIIADTYFEGQTGRGVQELKLGPMLVRLDREAIDNLQEQLASYIDHSALIGEE